MTNYPSIISTWLSDGISPSQWSYVDFLPWWGHHTYFDECSDCAPPQPQSLSWGRAFRQASPGKETLSLASAGSWAKAPETYASVCLDCCGFSLPWKRWACQKCICWRNTIWEGEARCGFGRRGNQCRALQLLLKTLKPYGLFTGANWKMCNRELSMCLPVNWTLSVILRQFLKPMLDMNYP